jgi:uncharacterized protein (DUF58 family)
MFLALAVLAIAGLAAAIWPAADSAWPWLAALVAIIALGDGLLGYVTRAPAIERNVPASMSLAAWVDVTLSLRNDVTPRTIRLRVFDHFPQTFRSQGMPQLVEIEAKHFVDIAYRVRPTARGLYEFGGCEVRIASPLGLWWRKRSVALPYEVRVYPNYSTISKLLAYEVENNLQLTGVRLSRRRGEGIEFHQLRDYREGDSLRAIDWKATARTTRLITREYQDERDQQIVFLLDAGRRMLAKDAELSHFDHALNAMLLLGYVALRQGDAAGVMTVGEKRTWLAPRKGMDAINGLLNHVYGIQPQPVEVDYVAAATELAVRQRRRALIVILTNVREEDSEDLQAATSLLKRRHLVMLASLRERALDEALVRPIRSFDDSLSYAATNAYLESRQESQKLLRARGVFVDDCLSEDLPSAITSRYLAIKRAGML